MYVTLTECKLYLNKAITKNLGWSAATPPLTGTGQLNTKWQCSL